MPRNTKKLATRSPSETTPRAGWYLITVQQSAGCEKGQRVLFTIGTMVLGRTLVELLYDLSSMAKTGSLTVVVEVRSVPADRPE